MKHQTIGLLTGAFLAQAILVLALFMSNDTETAADSDQTLLAVSPEQITQVTLEGPDSQVILTREDQQWSLPDYYASRADGEKLDAALKELTTLERGWPVAQSEDSARRFEVSEENFQRKVTLSGSDGEIATLYLGTTPALRQIHARLNGEEAIYVVNYAAFNLPAKPEEWLDPATLSLPEPEVTSIGTSEWRIRRDGEVWSFEAADAGVVNQAQAAQLASRLAALKPQSVLGTAEDPAWNMSAALSLSVELQDGTQHEYRLIKPEEDHAILKRSDDPRFFRVGAFAVNELIAASKESLTSAESEETAATDLEADETSSK